MGKNYKHIHFHWLINSQILKELFNETFFSIWKDLSYFFITQTLGYILNLQQISMILFQKI